MSHTAKHVASRLSKRRPKKPGKTYDAGFAIGVYGEDIVEQNAKEHFGPEYGDAEDRRAAVHAGFVDTDGRITKAGWQQLQADTGRLEHNSLRWLQETFVSAVDHGHDSRSDLVGNVTFDPKDPEQAENLYIGADKGAGERVDMSDASFGSLADSVWSGVSSFGQSVLGGGVNFFDVDPAGLEIAEATEYKIRRRRTARARKQ